MLPGSRHMVEHSSSKSRLILRLVVSGRLRERPAGNPGVQDILGRRHGTGGTGEGGLKGGQANTDEAANRQDEGEAGGIQRQKRGF